MTSMNIIYISIEGNTRSFLSRMETYAKQQHSFNPSSPLLNLKEITDQTEPANEQEPFFVFVPTYLDILFSNSFVRGPVVIHPESIASLTSSTSNMLISGGENGIFVSFMKSLPIKK